MGRGREFAKKPRRALLAAALVAGGCGTQGPLPVDLPPAHAVALPAALSTETIAVLDFEDARPEFERSEAAIDELFIGGRFLANDRFWGFHAVGGDLKEDPAVPPDLHARVTGSAAFSWYPFPNHGIGRRCPRRSRSGWPTTSRSIWSSAASSAAWCGRATPSRRARRARRCC